MKLNSNIILGAGLILGGLALAKSAKNKGKLVPIIGGFIPSVLVNDTPKSENFSGFNYRDSISRTWEH